MRTLELTLQRENQDSSPTMGTLSPLGFTCHTIERPAIPTDLAGDKFDADTICIPAGRYKLTKYQGGKFPFPTALLNGVAGHSYVELHPANWAQQLEACIAPGLLAGTLGDPEKGIPNGTPAVLSSDSAFKMIWAMFESAWESNEEVWLTIKNPEGASSETST